MSDAIKHECGLALIRLRKPLSHYLETYNNPLWGLSKLYLLMGKQQNRGQDGAGLAVVKLDMPPGQQYVHTERILEPNPPWQYLFKRVDEKLKAAQAQFPKLLDNIDLLKEHYPYAGELLMGHLRYATHGSLNVDNLHPVMRLNNWPTRSLVLAGNFNLTNVEFLLQKLVDLGQHPRHSSDTVTMLERVGHFIDREVQYLFDQYKRGGHSNREITELVAKNMNLATVLTRTAKHWDGGYHIGGLIGHGDAFVMRDPRGIRPSYYYMNDEVVAAASERPALATTFNVPIEEIQELPHAHALIIRKSGAAEVVAFAKQEEKRSCSFERIYFSRGSDSDIYRERIALGKLVTPAVLEAIMHDVDNTVFSCIPNTARVAFQGMQQALEDYLNQRKAETIESLHSKVGLEDAQRILGHRIRSEQVILKDTSLRTFIASDASRNDMAAHVYDITYGSLRPGKDNLVCIDDSIVRGTTLRQSILKILSRLRPRCIVIVSSCPQIRYPDCYGIDMSQIERFIAFQAAIALLKERGMQQVIDDTYQRIVQLRQEEKLESENCVQAIYAPFSETEISEKIAELLHTPELGCAVKMVFLPLAKLAEALPNHRGDWYFSGNYPTPGGNKVVNTAFVNYYEGKDKRAY